ncbi:MAG: glycosyltransferase [uncultured bacterium]|nr:MAG: glycosyltransferase [uncultured bacterium]KKU26440.1 MAG: Glycosyltransferase [Microgenomates group bacterium GW2011_GWA2_46_16]
MPTFTIITPSYQQGNFIRQTIDSVLSQSYKDFEYWIIDGGSTDRTKYILTSYGKRIHWVSEKDQGQAEAINKGLLKAKGDIVAWLNSDDFYEPGTLQKVSDYFRANPQIDFIFGDMNFVDRDGKNPQKCDYLSDFSLPRLLKYCYICQPSAFFRRSVIDGVGLLNAKYTYAFDYDYWLRIGQLMPRKIARVQLGVLANLRTYETRKTEAGLIPMRREVIGIMLSHGYWYAPAILESAYLILKSKLFNR